MCLAKVTLQATIKVAATPEPGYHIWNRFLVLISSAEIPDVWFLQNGYLLVMFD